MSKYVGEVGEVFAVSFAWTAHLSSFGEKPTKDRVFCAWCKKSQAEILKSESLEKHIDSHIEEESK